MARAFVLSPKISDAGVITASTSVANTSAVNLLRARPDLYWRSTNSTPYVEENFGSAKAIDTLTMGFANAVSGDTFRLRLASSQANLTASPVYDSGTVSFWPSGSDLSAYAKVHRVFTFAQQSAQWYRVDFSFATYVQMSRCIVGKRIEPAVSVRSGWSMGGAEEIAELTDMGGNESPRQMGVKRRQSVIWHDLVESERESLYTTLLERGSSKDIVLAVEPSEGRYCMSRVHIGRVKEAFSFPQTVLAGPSDDPDEEQHFSVSLTVQEMAPVEMAPVEMA